LRRFIISFSGADRNHTHVFSQLPGSGTDQITNILDEEQFDSRQFDLFESGADHVCLEVASSSRIVLDCLSTCCLNAFGVSACLDITFNHTNAKLSSES